MISRIVKDKNYSTISNVALNDPRLSLKAKGLYAYLMTKPDAWQISREGIRAQVKEGKAAIDAALKELEAAGYLQRERTAKDDQGHFKPESVLYENPLPENQPPENQPQVITNKVSTEYNNDTNVSLAPDAPEDKRRPDITEVVEKFETVLQLRLTRLHYQRRAANTLISRYGLERVLPAIEAVAACRDFEFAPQILSLEDLRDKWNRLEEFYRKQITPQKGKKGGLTII